MTVRPEDDLAVAACALVRRLVEAGEIERTGPTTARMTHSERSLDITIAQGTLITAYGKAIADHG